MPLFNEDIQTAPLPSTAIPPDVSTGPYQKPAQQSFFEGGPNIGNQQSSSSYEDIVNSLAIPPPLSLLISAIPSIFPMFL